MKKEFTFYQIKQLSGLHLIAFSLLTLFSSCDSLSPNGEALTGGADWYVATKHYETTDVVRNSNSTTHSLSSSYANNTLVVFFSAFPSSASKWYQVVNEQKAGLNTLGPNECAMEINIGSTDAYLSLGLDVDSIQVTVDNNNKINVDYPQMMRFKHMDNATFNIIDTVKCGKGAMQENN